MARARRKPNTKHTERYLNGLAAVLSVSGVLTEGQLRRVYEVFAVLNVPRALRVQFLRQLSQPPRARRMTSSR